MANVNPNHINHYAAGFVGALVLTIAAIGTLNYLANR